LVADAGYWRAADVDGTIPHAPELFISVAKHGRRGKPRRDGKPPIVKTLYLVEAMKAKLGTPRGKKMLRDRIISIEPLFGQATENRHARRFARRGLAAAQAEWHLIAATSNLRKLHQAQLAAS
jgi:hypothetical protein